MVKPLKTAILGPSFVQKGVSMWATPRMNLLIFRFFYLFIYFQKRSFPAKEAVMLKKGPNLAIKNLALLLASNLI